VDPSETGRRGFWLIDPVKDLLEQRFVSRGPIYMKEDFLVVPTANGMEMLKADITRRIEGWGFSIEELERVLLRASFTGCAADRSALHGAVYEGLRGIELYPESGPDFSHVIAGDDPALASAAMLALQKAAALGFTETAAAPTADDVNRAVLRLIYGAN